MNKRDLILLENMIDEYGLDMVVEALNLPPRIRKQLLTGAVATGLGLSAIGGYNAYTHRSPEAEEPQQEQVLSITDQIPNYFEIVDGVKRCMKYAVECIGNSESDIELDPELIVQKCYEHEYDLPTFLAALWQESHMGSTPRAKRTASPFSMGAWDNNTDHISYADQNDSIEPYIVHMQDKFQRGRSLEATFQDGQLVNGVGARYASDPKYESKVRYLRKLALKISPELGELDYYSET